MAREMKNSGVKWIGDIPKNWSLTRGQFLYSITTGKLDVNAEDPDGHYPFFTCSMYPKKIDSYAFDCEALLVAGNGLVGFTNYYKGKFNAYQRTYVLSNFRDINPIFLKYYVSRNLQTEVAPKSSGSVIQFIKLEDLQHFNICLPTEGEQKVIADFLDAKCGEIDGLLADLDAEVKTLTEYKKSLIAETVTRGLNPNAPMKSSGIPWAETIPTHWTIQKGKYTFQLLQRPVKEDDGVITCFRDGEVTLRSNRREDGFTMSEKEYGYQGIEPGDLVVHGMDGFAGSIGISDSRGKATPVLNVLDSNHNKRYLMYYLRNMAYGNVFLALSTGIRVRSCDLGWKKLGEIRIVIPPLTEQKAITDFLDTKCAAIDQAITDKTTQIETLKAYKASLIYEYVTGKKQVAL